MLNRLRKRIPKNVALSATKLAIYDIRDSTYLAGVSNVTILGYKYCLNIQVIFSKIKDSFGLRKKFKFSEEITINIINYIKKLK